jgi:transmembrane secretion effector
VQRSLLRVGDFRWLGTSMVLNSVGMMGEVVVLGWLALELTSSPFLVGVAMAMRSLPLFFVGVPAGVLADRFPRHRMLIVTGLGQMLTAATIGMLALVGAVRLPHVLLLTLAAGVMRGVEHAARQSYTHDVVGGAALMNGLAVLGVAMRSGWLVGSLGAGLVIARLGSGAAYVAVAASYLAGAAALLPASAPPASSRPGSGSLWRGMLAFVGDMRRDPVLPVLMTLTAAAEVLGFSHQALLPSLARDILSVGPEGLGVMNAARSLGGILGLAGVTTGSVVLGGGTLFVAVLVSFGASLVALGLAPQLVGYGGVVVVLIVANAMGALADLLAQSLMQLSVPAHLRGRAGGAWVVSIGLAPLGQLQIGALASLFGVSLALGASGLGLVVLACATALAFPRLRGV